MLLSENIFNASARQSLSVAGQPHPINHLHITDALTFEILIINMIIHWFPEPFQHNDIKLVLNVIAQKNSFYLKAEIISHCFG